MSVRKNDQTIGKLKVLGLSSKLAHHSVELCNNSNVFPKSTRFTLTNKIIDTSIDIMCHISTANSLKLEECYELRRKYQSLAKANLGKLLTLINFSYDVLNNLSGEKVEYWTKLVVETQKTLENWTKSDEKRLEKFKKDKNK